MARRLEPRRQAFHGEQYVAPTLTTRTWMDGPIEVDAEAWSRGGVPDDSRIVPWGVQSVDRDDLDYWQGRLERSVVDRAVASLVDSLRR